MFLDFIFVGEGSYRFVWLHAVYWGVEGGSATGGVGGVKGDVSIVYLDTVECGTAERGVSPVVDEPLLRGIEFLLPEPGSLFKSEDWTHHRNYSCRCRVVCRDLESYTAGAVRRTVHDPSRIRGAVLESSSILWCR